MFGKKIDNPVDDPILRPSLNSVRMTYDLAQKPEYQELMTAMSPYTGQRVNRFTHIHQSTEDLVKKVKMQRLLGQQTAACFQRWAWMPSTRCSPPPMRPTRSMAPTIMRTSSSSPPVQENDLTVDGAMTDPRGDRSKAPMSRPTPTCSYTSWAPSRRAFVVQGAKMHQTGCAEQPRDHHHATVHEG